MRKAFIYDQAKDEIDFQPILNKGRARKRQMERNNDWAASLM